ncbi:SDR family oxidoreductase [Saccharopolyspora sp. NPDC050642]|uniref:SDR family oxidoreductase n=1 Tax=Saccharopolyspora sp. NPDC050642 TaxID=3157099 RepID=UPI0033C3D2C2
MRGGALCKRSCDNVHRNSDCRKALPRPTGRQLSTAHGIRGNSVHPGSIETGSATSVRRDESDVARACNARTLAAIPLGARGEPRDVAHGVLFLASDESKYVTGAELVLDGGCTAV